ncbi:hypothetical protein MMC06_000881 [Schaereria dolodes]|nr:hypothetical protein [Schaereria dolodes]
MFNPQSQHQRIPDISTSHPDNPIPEEPSDVPQYAISQGSIESTPQSPAQIFDYSPYSTDSESPTTPNTDPQLEDAFEESLRNKTIAFNPTLPKISKKRRASTVLLSQNPDVIKRILGEEGGTEKICCGGGCCFLNTLEEDLSTQSSSPVVVPGNDAFRSLQLNIGPLSLNSKLTNVAELLDQTVYLDTIFSHLQTPHSTRENHPPKFVTPHHPYEVFSAKVHHARELTKPGAEKRTYHFDLDVTDYPAEGGNVDFVVGGAIGVCAPNAEELVDDVFDLLSVPKYVRDRPVTLRTTSGRWPTIWGEDMARKLTTTRRELLTWCSDLQSYSPSKMLLRLLGEYAEAENERKILLYLCSAQGQAAFCELRTGPHITLAQLLNAFPSAKPPLPHLLSVLNNLMPRFYSLSQDPQISDQREGQSRRRLIEIAVTVHEMHNWRDGPRTGLGSGYLERIARKMIEAEKLGLPPADLDLRVPMFRGLMANPLAREFVSDGPMLLIGAGVGVAPFRGFVQRRLKSANCANKVWVLQGVRDSLLDELYSGEWGVHEEKVKKVVQSRKGKGRYVQEEVRNQADLVWFIINALDGRVFVCGSSKGMGEGVEVALVDVAMDKGNMNKEEAQAFWQQKKSSGQYIAETW